MAELLNRDEFRKALEEAIKGKSATRLMRDFRSLNRTFWGRHLWARGYFVATSGNITDEVITKYIADQGPTADKDKRAKRADTHTIFPNR